MVIVNLTCLMEDSVSLCHQYWPEDDRQFCHIYEASLSVESLLAVSKCSLYFKMFESLRDRVLCTSACWSNGCNVM